MLLLNKTLLRLAKGLWGWICAITAVRLLYLAAVTGFAASISSLIGNMVNASISGQQAGVGGRTRRFVVVGDGRHDRDPVIDGKIRLFQDLVG